MQLNGANGKLAPWPVVSTMVVPERAGEGGVLTVPVAKLAWLSKATG